MGSSGNHFGVVYGSIWGRLRVNICSMHFLNLGSMIGIFYFVHCRKIRRQAGEVESLNVMPTSSGVALDLRDRDIVIFDDICDSAAPGDVT